MKPLWSHRANISDCLPQSGLNNRALGRKLLMAMDFLPSVMQIGHFWIFFHRLEIVILILSDCCLESEEHYPFFWLAISTFYWKQWHEIRMCKTDLSWEWEAVSLHQMCWVLIAKSDLCTTWMTFIYRYNFNTIFILTITKKKKLTIYQFQTMDLYFHLLYSR